MLGQHPQAYGVPELNLFAGETLGDLIDQMKGLRKFQMDGLLRTVSELYGREQKLVGVEMANRWLLKYYDYSTGEIYEKLCKKVAPKMIIDKSPVYGTRPEILNRIGESWGDAYFLHLVRHPRTQGNSMMTVADGMMTILSSSIDYSTEPPVVDPQYLWLRMQRNIMNFLSSIPEPQKMFLRGEDILSNPEIYFEKICRWLNLDWNEKAYQCMLHPEKSCYACLGPYGASLGNDPNFLKSPIFKQRKIPLSTLVGSLSWRNDGKGFINDVIQLAHELGYS
jgi:hypothetical protein